jgi:DNA-binding beta-propeller fold protein YncE
MQSATKMVFSRFGRRSAARLLLLLAAPALLLSQYRGTVLVANQESSSATLIDLGSGASTEIPVGVGPHEATILPGGRRGVVTVYGDRSTVGHQLAVIDLVGKRVERMIELGAYARPHGVLPVAGRPNVVVVTSEASRNLVLVNVETGEIERAIPTMAPSSHMVALATSGRLAGVSAWTANVATGSISEVDLAAGVHRRVIPVSTVTEGIAVTPDGSQIWVGSNDKGTISVVSAETGMILQTITGLGMPYRIGVSPNGAMAVAVDPTGNRVVFIDVATRKVVSEIGGLDSPRGVAIASDSRTVMVTSGAGNSVILVDLVGGREVRRFPVGASPDGVGYEIK